MKQTFYSPGKLLLTGEYVVLDGAQALAIPTKFGQSLSVEPISESKIEWTSLDKNHTPWYETVLVINSENEITTTATDSISTTLIDILQAAQRINPTFLLKNKGFRVTTTLQFPREWGLGSSSTLITNIALWADVDAFKLLDSSFGGSGYDIAVAQRKSPILYRKGGLDGPFLKSLPLKWPFMNSIFFVHLNRKQDSKEGIANYRNAHKSAAKSARISAISEKLPTCESISHFEGLLQEHESIISEIIGVETVKQLLFSDYPRTVKSLGAWGGDFVLAVGNEAHKAYFREKGYKTILSFEEMVAG